MTLAKYYGNAQDRLGRALPGASITVHLTGTNTLASLFQDDGTTVIANPMLADTNGVFGFNAATSQKYDILATYAGALSQLLTNISLPGSSGGGGGTVDTVVAGTAIHVDSTDPANPVVRNDGVRSVVAGTNVTVDITDPRNPVVSSSSGGGGGTITDWADEATTIEATTTNPTKGGTIERDHCRWRRVGDSIEIHIDYHQSVAGSNGSGTYLFKLPAGAGSITVDATKTSFIAGSNLFGGGCGGGNISDESSFSRPVCCSPYDTHHFKATDFAVGDIGSVNASLSTTKMCYSFSITLPITEWA